jgi:hypothetical protein
MTGKETLMCRTEGYIKRQRVGETESVSKEEDEGNLKGDAPYNLRRRISADIAGVAMMAFCPTKTCKESRIIKT